MMAIPATMQAMVLTGHGGLDRLEWREDVPVPSPDRNEVLIRVGAAPETPQAPGGSDRRSLQQTTTWTSN